MEQTPFGTSMFWSPGTGGAALLVNVPSGLRQIKDREHLRWILARNLSWKARQEENPGQATAYLVEQLELAGLTDPYLDRDSLERGTMAAWERLCETPGVQERLEMLLPEDTTFPLAPRRDPQALDEFLECGLEAWANEVTSGPLL